LSSKKRQEKKKRGGDGDESPAILASRKGKKRGGRWKVLLAEAGGGFLRFVDQVDEKKADEGTCKNYEGTKGGSLAEERPSLRRH